MIRKLFSLVLLGAFILLTIPQELHVLFDEHKNDEHCKIPSHYHISELHHHCNSCHFEIPFFEIPRVKNTSELYFSPVNSTLPSHSFINKLATQNYLLRGPPLV